MNEVKVNGGGFEDYDFTYVGDNLNSLKIEYKYKPTLSQVKNDLQLIKNKYNEDSNYYLFEPKLLIIYYYVYGHTSGYGAYLTIDENSRYLNRPFFDEPTGKYAKARQEFKL